MRYSIEPGRYVKGYGFLFFAKNIGKNISNKHGQKPLDSAKKSTIKKDTIRLLHKGQLKKQQKQLEI